jgi:hypothetical protein
MKLIYFRREEDIGLPEGHASEFQGFYIPAKRMVIFYSTLQIPREPDCPLLRQQWSLWKKGPRVEEVERGCNHEIVADGSVHYSDIQEIEYEDAKIEELIKNMEERNELEIKINNSFQELFNNLIRKT